MTNLYKEARSDGTTYQFIKETRMLHRDNGPSVIHSDGQKEWRGHGEYFKDCKPPKFLFDRRDSDNAG